MINSISITDEIVESMAREGRRVLSQWRALVYIRRATSMLPPDARRWRNTPSTPKDIRPALRRMQDAGLIDSLPSAPGCYVVMEPYARRLQIRERELLFELNPSAVLTTYSALEFHGFTLDQPKVITAWAGDWDTRIPLGTSVDDWVGIRMPIPYRPKKVISQKVDWVRSKMSYPFGISTEFDGPIPIRVTDRERTLIDSLQQPGVSGGIANVLNSWRMAKDFVDVNTIVEYTEQYGIGLLRQRVGYVSEAIGLNHGNFDAWANESSRGGSSKLLGAEPFSSKYDKRWNLSLNVPIGSLEEAWD